MATLLQDDFTRANSTTVVGSPAIGPAPVTQAGVAGISTNSAYASTAPTIVTYDLGTPNVELQITGNNVSTVNAVGIVIGYVSATDYWGAYLLTSACQLFRATPGGLSILLVADRPNMSSGAQLKVNYRDGVIRVYVDNNLAIYHEVDAPITATKHGFRTNHATPRVDDLLGVDSPAVVIDGFLGEDADIGPVETDEFFTPSFAYQGHDTKVQDQAAGS